MQKKIDKLNAYIVQKGGFFTVHGVIILHCVCVCVYIVYIHVYHKMLTKI